MNAHATRQALAAHARQLRSLRRALLRLRWFRSAAMLKAQLRGELNNDLHRIMSLPASYWKQHRGHRGLLPGA